MAGGQIDFLGGGYDQNRNLHLRIRGGVLAGAFCGVFGGVSMKKGICRHLKRIYIDEENTDCRCMKQGCKVKKKDCKECKQWEGA